MKPVMRTTMFLTAVIFAFVFANSSVGKVAGRQTISLNGEWEFKANNGQMPEVFTGKIPVPGLVDLAEPKVDFENMPAFWYKKTIDLSSYDKTEKVFLHVDLSKYGTEAWINGKYLGAYYGCYTSFEFDITQHVKWKGENTILLKVGQRSGVIDKSAVGHDGEMKYNIPGIWGDVSLILAGDIYIRNVQVISDINNNELTTNIRYKNYSGLKDAKIEIKIIEDGGEGKILTGYKKDTLVDESGKIHLKIPINDYKLWSPDSPFLYKMSVSLKSGSKVIDNVNVVFGIREFKIKDGDFYLNGNKIFLKGSNIAFHRFLSDPQRGNLVWDENWIKRVLVDIPKECNMNIFRMHVGHVYNKWYDIADKYGMMIQDEWAFFGVTGTQKAIDEEYAQWIMDNWNHPSIIIWDPMNELRHSYIENTVVPKLKELDPSRPWEVVDFIEDHCYIYSNGPVLHKRQWGPCPPIPEILNKKTPVMINEYLWFWLDNKGIPTFFSNPSIQRWIGKNTSDKEKLEYQAFLAGELTELWRRLRVDAIMPFVYLSIDGAYTSNFFLGDIKNLKPKPVLKALKEAFSPFGVSIELWDRHFYVNEKRRISVYIFNDNPFKENGELLCSIVDKKTGDTVYTKKLKVEIDPSDFIVREIMWNFPGKEGEYSLNAELFKNGKYVTKSQKPAYVFKMPEVPDTLKEVEIKVWSQNDEILTFLKKGGLNVVRHDFRFNGEFILIVDNEILITEKYKQSIPDLTNFVKAGGTLLAIEPSCGTPEDEESKIDVLKGFNLLIRWKVGMWTEGYDSFIHKDEDNINNPVWDGLEKEHLRMFNGAWGGEVVSECDVLFPEGGRVLSRHGPELKSANIVAFEYGTGAVIISRLQIRDRLVNNKKDRYSLYNRREDPVLQQIFLNLLNTYRNPGEIRHRMNIDKKGAYKIYKEEIITAVLKGEVVKLDGNLDDWRFPAPVLMNKNNSLEFGNIKDDNDLSSKFYFMWDNENLYFAIDVRDDIIIQNREKEDIWQEDCVELFIDPKGDGFRWGNPEDLQIGIAPDTKQKSNLKIWEWFKKEDKVYESITGKYRLTENGYVAEAAIPWKVIGLEAKNGLKFNLSVALHDTDADGEKFDQSAKLNFWFRSSEEKSRLGVIELKNNP